MASPPKRKTTAAKKTLRPKPLFPLLVFFCVLLIVASGVLLFLVRNHLAAAQGIEKTTHLEAQEGFPSDYSEAQSLHPFAGGILKVTSSKVSFLEVSTGNELYAVDVDLNNDPICVIQEDKALVADNSGFICIQFNTKGEVYRAQLSQAISFATLSADGKAALITEETDSKGAVVLLSETGNILGQWNSVESGYPVSASFSPSGERLDIALVDTDGSVMQPLIKQIDIVTAKDKVTLEDRAVYVPDAQGILAMMAYLSEDEMLLAGADTLLAVTDNKSQLVREGSYAQIYSLLGLPEGAFVIYSEAIGEQIKIDHINKQLGLETTMILGDNFIDWAYQSGKLLLAVDKRLLLLDAATMTVESDISVDEKLLSVDFYDGTHYTLVTEAGVRKIKF